MNRVLGVDDRVVLVRLVRTGTNGSRGPQPGLPPRGKRASPALQPECETDNNRHLPNAVP